MEFAKNIKKIKINYSCQRIFSITIFISFNINISEQNIVLFAHRIQFGKTESQVLITSMAFATNLFSYGATESLPFKSNRVETQ